MKETINKYSCDLCHETMSESEYSLAPTIRLMVILPSDRGRISQQASHEMTICSHCGRELGIENLPEYHGYTSSERSLEAAISRASQKAMEAFQRMFSTK